LSKVVALAPDLFFASKIQATLAAAGHEVVLESAASAAVAAAGNADVVVADLHAPDLDIESFADRLRGKPILGFYSHVEAALRREAEEAGFDLVVPRSRMARDMPDLIAQLLRVG
jgi:CheY-like chemotaxis protein